VSVVERNLIYRKTQKGAEAIATRQHGLSPRQRSVLIMVDGKRSVDELARLGASQGDGAQVLDDLLATGCIEATAGAAAVAAPSVQPSVAPFNLAEAQRFASRRLTDILGPTSESLCLRIEAARNVQDFQTAMTRAQAIVREFRGGAVADAFANEVQAYRSAS
jgi:hypothetical protein